MDTNWYNNICWPQTGEWCNFCGLVFTIVRFMSMHKSMYTAKPNVILYFNMTHYWVMRIASWVILSNVCAKQTAWLFTDTETISHPPNPSFSLFIAYMLNTAERFIMFFRFTRGSMWYMSNVECGRTFKTYYNNYQTGNGGCTDLVEHWISSGIYITLMMGLA
jgi:hypothetical protein